MAEKIKPMPAGMREVSKEEFFEAIRAGNLNVHPSPEKFETIWRFLDMRYTVFGWCSRGYCGPFEWGSEAPPESYAIVIASDYIEGEIERRTDEDRMSRMEAVQRMLEVYEAAPKPVSKPWQVAA